VANRLWWPSRKVVSVNLMGFFPAMVSVLLKGSFLSVAASSQQLATSCVH
jgi:hypothetical protein